MSKLEDVKHMLLIGDYPPQNWVSDVIAELERDAREVIDSSGYTIDQLAKIENAFESAPQGNTEEEYMFNGLMAVVEVLAKIHGIDLETKEKAKLQFKRVA